MATQPQNSQQQARHGGGDPGVALVKAIAGRAIKSPRVQFGMVMWLIGLLFMIWAPGLHTVTPEIKQTYEDMVVTAANMPEYHEAYAQYVEAQSYADEAKVWFWRFREPFRSQVNERQAVAYKWQTKLDQADAVRESKMRQAKAYVGLWSDYGMTEVRSRFWDAFEKGKIFAQQQTFYHMIMRVLASRDEELLSTVLNWIFVALMNFTTGLLGALFYFFFSLVSMVWSYQPDPLSALAFCVLGFVGGASVIASYLFALYGMVASSVYVVGKVVVRDALQQEQQRQRLRNQQQQWRE